MAATWRGRHRPFVLCLALACALTATVGAADMGSVSGTVFNDAAEPAADAIVTVSGDRLPVGRSVQTGSNGTFRFDYLLPGRYVITVTKPGVGTGRREAAVEVGRDTQVDFVIGLALSEEISVRPANPLVDVRSTEVSLNYRSETLATLPLERTYRGLFQLMPGVGDNRSIVGPAAGGSRTKKHSG